MKNVVIPGIGFRGSDLPVFGIQAFQLLGQPFSSKKWMIFPFIEFIFRLETATKVTSGWVFESRLTM